LINPDLLLLLDSSWRGAPTEIYHIILSYARPSCFFSYFERFKLSALDWNKKLIWKFLAVPSDPAFSCLGKQLEFTQEICAELEILSEDIFEHGEIKEFTASLYKISSLQIDPQSYPGFKWMWDLKERHHDAPSWISRPFGNSPLHVLLFHKDSLIYLSDEFYCAVAYTLGYHGGLKGLLWFLFIAHLSVGRLKVHRNLSFIERALRCGILATNGVRNCYKIHDSDVAIFCLKCKSVLDCK
jgi:hypothetical protein